MVRQLNRNHYDYAIVRSPVKTRSCTLLSRVYRARSSSPRARARALSSVGLVKATKTKVPGSLNLVFMGQMCKSAGLLNPSVRAQAIDTHRRQRRALPEQRICACVCLFCLPATNAARRCSMELFVRERTRALAAKVFNRDRDRDRDQMSCNGRPVNNNIHSSVVV